MRSGRDGEIIFENNNDRKWFLKKMDEVGYYPALAESKKKLKNCRRFRT